MGAVISMRALSFAVATLALDGCVPPKPAPVAPTQLRVARTPTEVVQVATRELATAGFAITVSDAAAGTVVARRVRTPDAHGADVTCQYKHGSMAATGAEATMTVNVSAKAASSFGSDVLVVSSVHNDFSKLPGIYAQQASSDDECVSSGVIEKRIAEALR